RRQRFPQLLAGVLVEGDGDAPLAADDANEAPAVHERVAGVAPDRGLGAVVLLEVLRPDHVALLGVQADKVPLGAQRVHLAVVHGRRAARPAGVGNLVGAGVLVLPEDVAVGGVEAEDALLTRDLGPVAGVVQLAHVGVGHVVGDVDAAASDRRAGVAPGDGNAPLHLGP